MFVFLLVYLKNRGKNNINATSEPRENKKRKRSAVVVRPQLLSNYPKMGFGDSSSPDPCPSLGVSGCGCVSVGVSPRTTT